MTVRWIRSPQARLKPAGALVRAWWALLARRRRSQSEHDRRVSTQCFGGLTTRQERLVEGLVAKVSRSAGDLLEQ